ncbi:MAG: PAS domain-containing protein [Bacilli bacterium]|jgi:predicted transcriptional regulator YheO|nr:PAS domain-containing protein [Bacilli bacterium]
MNRILNRYITLVDFLELMLGPNYEIVLHDLTKNNGKIIKIANGHITGRKIGDPLTPYSLSIVKEETYKDKEFEVNYQAKAQSGRLLRSCTLFIKNENSDLIGLLCINFDDIKFLDLTEQLIQLIHPDEAIVERKNIQLERNEVTEVISESVNDVINNVINDVFYKDTKKNLLTETSMTRKLLVSNMSTTTRQNIIAALEQRGLFLIKGSVQEAAKELNCSMPSIYRYLNIIKFSK